MHLLLGAYWVYQRDRRFLLSVAVLALGYGALRSYIGIAEERPAQAHTLTVASYNLLGGRFVYRPDAEITAERIDELLGCLDADVVAFQEFTRYGELQNRLDAAFAKTGLKHHYRPPETFVALYSRYPILEQELLAAYNNANGAVRCQLALPNDTLDVIVAHMQSNQVSIDASELVADAAQANKQAYWTLRTVASNYRRAARQRVSDAKELAQVVGSSQRPLILLGDLNDTPLSYTLGTLKRAGLKDAFRQNGSGLGFTYAGSIPGLRIDYTLHTAELETLSSTVVDCGFSDHKAVRSVLSW